MKVAALDLGSNTFLLLIAEVENASVKETYFDKAQVVRLGQDLQKNGYFHADALKRADQCLNEFKKIINEHKPEKVLAMATSAARDAKNFQELHDICRSYDVPLQIISGQEEAQITFNGSVSFLNHPGNVIVVDIGGGSTELIYGSVKDQKIIFSKSYDIGCVRLTEKFVKSDPPHPSEVDLIGHEVTDKILDFSKQIQISPETQIIAVAGTPTALAASELGGYDDKKVNGYKISKKRLQDWCGDLAAYNHSEKVKKFNIESGRADVILVGALTLWALCDVLNKEEIIVSTRGVRYGVALKME
jgi:exopolyphosphatase / guanosine-5'-triphosphate,3'-diphosphate pyrophosphatase